MITSKDNNLIKLCNSIKSKKGSRETGLCFVESYKVVKELYDRGRITHIFTISQKSNLFDGFKCKVDIISENIAKSLSDVITTDGVFGIVKIEKVHFNYSRTLILDRIQDPSNIGAIIRSAKAFGFNKILAINSVYPYTSKCIRASMSYIFDIDYNDINYDKLLDLKKDNNLSIYCADMNGIDIDKVSIPKGNIAVVIGNEGQGIDNRLFEIADKTIKIPMSSSVESLNASVSAGIIMFNFKK